MGSPGGPGEGAGAVEPAVDEGREIPGHSAGSSPSAFAPDRAGPLGARQAY